MANLLVLAVGGLVIFHGCCCHAAPASATDTVLLGQVDVNAGNVELSTEDAIPQKCIFGGIIFSHSQTIPSKDPCSHCLCVAGEVYCWWQDCLLPQNYNNSEVTTKTTEFPTTYPDIEVPVWLEDNATLVSTETEDNYEASGALEEDVYMEANATYQEFSTSTFPTACIVMGREYKEGEALPHSTGNCVECSCGSGGRVECSPRDCVPLQPSGPEGPDGNGASNGFAFEAFEAARSLDRSRGLDETF